MSKMTVIRIDENDLLSVLLGLRLAVEMTESKQLEKGYRKAYRIIHEQLLNEFSEKWVRDYELGRELD